MVEIRDGCAEDTGCADRSMDAVLRPGGRLVITVHRHVLDISPEQLTREVVAAGFVDVSLHLRSRRLNSPAIELLAGPPTG